jgi:hypothetical protein
MNTLRKNLVTFAVLGMLALIGSLMNSHYAVAQGLPTGQSVNIVNPLPVPVTGTVNVGNLGAAPLPVSVINFPATQNISGTVNIGALPSVRAMVLNGAGSTPFSRLLSPPSPEFTVPATISGQTVLSLVITEVSGYCTGVCVHVAVDSVAGQFSFPLGTLSDGTPIIYAQQTNIFEIPGSVIRLASTAGSSAYLALSGYYVTQ